MNRNYMQSNFRRAALRGHGTAHTVLLQMAENDARAGRIKALKEGRPGTKWKHLAEFAGVSERAVGDWYGTGAISEDNALKVAEFFKVPFDYVWSGTEPKATPTPFAGHDALADRLDAIEQRVSAQLAEHASKVEALLREQSDLLEEIRQQVAEQKTLKAETDEIRPWIQALREGLPEAQSESTEVPKPKPRAKKRTAARRAAPRTS
jgi:hypothetical protein